MQPLQGSVFAVTLIAATLPFVVSIAVSLRGASRPRDVYDYFLYGRSLTPALFLRTSVGYSLQAAAIFLFIDWTVRYGPVRAAIVPLCWGAGYWLVGLALTSGRLNGFLGSSSKAGATVHGYIGEKLGTRRRRAQLVLAISTIIGLGGTLIVEADYATTFVRTALGFPEAYDTLLEVAVLTFCGFYVLWGGYKAAVDTDLAQIPAAYAGVAVAILVLLEEASHRGTADAAVLAIVALVLFAIILQGRHVVGKRGGGLGITDRVLFGFLAAAAAIIAVVALTNSRTGGFSLKLMPPVEHFGGFGVVGMVSLVFANLFWQFIDLSSLQRLQSVRMRTAEGDGAAGATRPEMLNAEDVSALRLGLRRTGIETAGGWVLAILLALSLQLTGYMPGDVGGAPAIASFVAALGGNLVWVLPILTFGVACFMLSTVDTLIAAIAFVSYEDVVIAAQFERHAGAQRAHGDQHLGRARWTTLAALALLYVAYLGLQHGVRGEDIAPVLYAVYAVQASIGVVILVAFFAGDRLAWLPIVLSIITGWVAALAVALNSPPSWLPGWLMPIDSWWVFPPLAAFLASLVTYLIVEPFTRATRRSPGVGASA